MVAVAAIFKHITYFCHPIPSQIGAERFRPHSSLPDIDDLSGQIAIAAENISLDSKGQVQMRGTTWSARNLGPSDLAMGQRCRVVRSIGIALEVCPLSVNSDADAVQPNSATS